MDEFTLGSSGYSLGIYPFLFVPGSPGSDIIPSFGQSAIYWGRSGNDTIYSFEPGANNPWQIDLIFGDLVDATLFSESIELPPRDWENRFILGDWQNPYYVSSLPLIFGLERFAIIADFNSGKDTIQLHGTPQDYQLITTPLGMGIFWQQFPTPDLIAFLPGVSDLSLAGDYFEFEGDTPPPSSIPDKIEQLGTAGIDIAADSATDSFGNLFVAGAGDGDNWLAKYDGDGNQLWLRRFGDSLTLSNIATDNSGNVYVVEGLGDVTITKYDSDGNPVWIENFANETHDFSNSIDVDDEGNVYLSGQSVKSASEDDLELLGLTFDSWTTKYDRDGNQLWFREFEASGLDEAYDVVVDSDSNVYATGWTLGDFGGEFAGLYDVWLAKLDSEGEPIWLEQFGSEDYEFPWGIDTDSQGNLYAAGWTLGDLEGANAGSYDTWIAKYDSNGDRLWLEQFGSNGDDGSFLGGMEIDSNDNIFLTGYTDSNLGGANAGSYDAWVAKYDSDGKQIWIQQFGTPEFDYAGSISADDFGNLYLTGFTEGSLGELNAGLVDGWIAKLDARSGTLKDFNASDMGASSRGIEENQLLTTDILNAFTTGLDPLTTDFNLSVDNSIDL